MMNGLNGRTRETIFIIIVTRFFFFFCMCCLCSRQVCFIAAAAHRSHAFFFVCAAAGCLKIHIAGEQRSDIAPGAARQCVDERRIFLRGAVKRFFFFFAHI